jgi:selenocysteine-specific elongation factor
MRHVVIGTAGHIDHGKSSLVLALTGIDPDRLKEEKARGITIDLGFAHFQDGDVTYAFVDVPGHERFVKNMLAGATGIDVVLLVVAADESVKPQTREHFEICRLLQVGGGIVALTKADLVDEDTIELVRLETRELVAGTFLDEAPIVPVSARTRSGLDELKGRLADLVRERPARSVLGAARLPVDRVFSMKGFGTVVTGTLASGEIGVDQELAVLPKGRRVKVRGVQVHGRRHTRAVAGQRAAVNLGGVDLADIVRGETLAAPDTLDVTRRFDATLELVANTKPLRHGARVRFHQGTSEVLGRVILIGPRHGSSAQAATSSELGAGRSAYVRMRLEAPAVLTRGDRFILRAYSPPVTIGGGQVLDPQPPRGATRTDAARARLARLDVQPGAQPDAAAAVLEFVQERSAAGLPSSALVSRAGLSPDAAQMLASRLVAEGRVVCIADLLVSRPILAALEQRLLDAIRDYHRAEPLSEGLAREEARERLFRRAAPAVFERVLHDLMATNRIVARDRLALPGHQVELSGPEARARDAIEQAYRSGGLKPPDEAALAGLAGANHDIVDRVVKLLLRQRVLVRLETLIFHREALERLKADVRALKQQPGEAKVDVARFKERYDITRKYAIPLLEYLDRERITKRVGESRVVL